MHHFLYSIQDAYISNKPSEKDKNFGLDEMLVIGVSHSLAKIQNNTKTYNLRNEYVAGVILQNYSGIITGSFNGMIPSASVFVNGGLTSFIASYFSGSVTGSVTGFETGSFLSGQFSGSLFGFNGSITSYTIDGVVTGSITSSCFSTIRGNVNFATGSFTGYLTGIEVKYEQNTTVVDTQYLNRTLVKFDLNFISQSIVNGDIVSPKFFLKLFSAEARELPTSYDVVTYPISQSWDQGDGYFSDGGSTNGVSWNWRNYYSGSSWSGGSWYDIPCSQSFSYEVSDINMNVTPIVNSWLNNTVPNEGFILMFSGDVNPTGSNPYMFLFSKETNTIYSPRLDIMWDDSSWVTGSYGTGSVTVYPQTGSINNTFLSGFLSNTNIDSMISCSLISNFPQTITDELSGSLTGSISFTISETGSYFATGSDGNPYTGSISGSIMSGILDGTIVLGDLSGSYITGSSDGNQFSASYGGIFSGSLTGSISFTISETGSYFATGSNGNTYTGSISGSVTSGVLDGIVVLGDLSGSYITGSSDRNQFSASYGGTFVSYLTPVFSGSFSGSGIYGDLLSKYVFGDIEGVIVSGSMSASIYTGNLSGSLVTGSSDGTYFIGGLYDSEFFLSGSNIIGGMSGSVLTNTLITSSLYSGYVSGYIDGQVISGIFTSGELIGTNFVGIISGSYSTSSYSVETIITSSVFVPINSKTPFVVIIQDLKKEYSFGDVPRIGVFCREHFPLKTFGKSPQQLVYLTPKLLPTSSFYSIKDNETEETIVDFDNYTKISCDLDGQYFNLDTTSLSQERYYRVLIRVDFNDGNIYTFDSNDLFKVRR